MALSKEQFMNLRRQGLSVDQIIRFENEGAPASVKAKQQEKQAKIQEDVIKSKKEADFLQSPLGMAKSFGKEIGRMAVQAPLRFGASALEVPGQVKRFAQGDNQITSQKEYNIPIVGGKFKSYQSEFEKDVPKIISGEKPLTAALKPFAEASLDALATAGMAKSLIGDVKYATKPEPFIKEFQKQVSLQLKQYSAKAEDIANSINLEKAKSVKDAGNMLLKALPKNLARDVHIKGSIDNWVKSAEMTMQFAGKPELQVMQGFIPKTIKALSSGIKDLGNKKAYNQVLNIVSEPETRKEAIGALTKSGKPGGLEQKGLFGNKVGITPTQYNQEVARTATPFYDKNPVKFAKNLNKGIEEGSKGVESFLKGNQVKYNQDELLSRIEAIQPSRLLSPEQKTAVQAVKDLMKDEILRFNNTNNSLWDARKSIDQILLQEKPAILGDKIRFDNVTTAAKQGRRIINNYIAEITPAGEQFTSQMRVLSNMFDSLDEVGRAYGPQIFKKLGQQKIPAAQRLLNIGKNPAVQAGLAAAGAMKLFGGSKTQ